ncbi:reverse transcriptase domain-containing protein [Pseudomonas syringae]|uniref:reverse transcriptase domain-containing protein n=1 Tax=Pseudomonas syringae TaxID=317 RepID=UPI003F829741
MIKPAESRNQKTVEVNMIKRPLEQLFFATFRGKQDFQDFIKLDLAASSVKKNFEGRSVYAPEPKLKLYLGFLSRVLFDRLPLAEQVVYSYRKGVNVVNAVEKHSSSKYFFQTDIESFFGSINREIIRRSILWSLDFCPISDIDVWIDRILDIVTVDGLLPPGFPTSPAISNCCLVKFDEEFLSWCDSQGFIYTRYADDLIVSSKVDPGVDLLVSKITEILNKMFDGDFKLNLNKTRVVRPGSKVKLLGVVILPNGKVSIDGNLKKNVETAMYHLLKNKEKFVSFLKEQELDRALQKFSGQLNYINTVDPDFLDKLRRKYGATAVDKIIHVSVAV